jgi:inorganic pyrophosphatase
MRDLTEPLQEELEKFFTATEELEDKKLKFIGWDGPDSALAAVTRAAKRFQKHKDKK